MTNEIERIKLTAAITILMEAEDKSDKIQLALKSYQEDPENEEFRDTLSELIDGQAQAYRPFKEILANQWAQSIANASKAGLIKPLDEGKAHTIIGEIWPKLIESGWDALPDYRHRDLSETLASTMHKPRRHVQGNREDTPKEIATALLADINAGNLPLSAGGELFTNFNDGVRLHVEMKDWQPVLRERSRDGEQMMPKPSADGKVLQTTVNFPSGKVLVADAIRVGNLGQALSDYRQNLGLNINYQWHRILRTVLCAHTFNTVDIAMGDDGPGLVRADGDSTVFAGYDSEGFPEIANVCHDYWGTTMIDRDVLVQMASSDDKSVDEIQSEIDDWLAASQFHTQIEMPAGTWNLYFDDDRETLNAELRKAGIDAPEDTRFVLSQEPLALDADKVAGMNHIKYIS
jgi:hypothetical protein